jgi:hypothetical protein
MAVPNATPVPEPHPAARRAGATVLSGPWVASLAVAEIAEAHALMLEIVAEVERQARVGRADVGAALEGARRELETLSRGLSPFERLELLRDSALEAQVAALAARTLPLVRGLASGRMAPEEVRQKGRVMAAEHAALGRQARGRGLDLCGELADLEVEIRFIIDGGVGGSQGGGRDGGGDRGGGTSSGGSSGRASGRRMR